MGIKQLNIDPYLIGNFLHATLKNIGHAKLLRDLGEIARFALITLGGSAGNDFQIRDLGQACENFLLNPIGEISICFVLTQILKRQHGDAFFRNN